MAAVTLCEMFGHKKTTKIETKQREDTISVALPGHQPMLRNCVGSCAPACKTREHVVETLFPTPAGQLPRDPRQFLPICLAQLQTLCLFQYLPCRDLTRGVLPLSRSTSIARIKT